MSAAPLARRPEPRPRRRRVRMARPELVGSLELCYFLCKIGGKSSMLHALPPSYRRRALVQVEALIAQAERDLARRDADQTGKAELPGRTHEVSPLNPGILIG